MATHSSILTWRIPWTEESGGLTVHWAAKSQTRLEQLSMHAVYVCCIKLIGFGVLCGVAREN